jgi:hypothetical protein
MPLVDILTALKADLAQSESLIAHVHALDHGGQPILPALDQRQVTISAFLNMFIAWETFLEKAFADYMTGESTIGGRQPIRYVLPHSIEAARTLIVGTQRYFDYGNHENVKKVARMFFENGDPFEPHISAFISDLADIRTMRNASAHITSTTQTALEGLALRIFGQPKPGIDLYYLLISPDPRTTTGYTVFAVYRDKLLTAAGLIAQ